MNIMSSITKKTGVREAAHGKNVGADFYEELEGRVKELVERAVQRAEENGRKTLKARDA